MYNFETIFVKVFFPIALLFPALFTGILTYNNYKKVNKIIAWKDINVTIIESSIKKNSTSKFTSYCPNIIVNYSFKKSYYKSKLAISSEQCNLLKPEAENTLKKYQKGDTILALLNPNKPSEIRIKPYSYDMKFYLSFFLFISILGLILYIVFIPIDKLKKKKN